MSLAGYSPKGCTEWGMTECLSMQASTVRSITLTAQVASHRERTWLPTVLFFDWRFWIHLFQAQDYTGEHIIWEESKTFFLLCQLPAGSLTILVSLLQYWFYCYNASNFFRLALAKWVSKSGFCSLAQGSTKKTTSWRRPWTHVGNLLYGIMGFPSAPPLCCSAFTASEQDPVLLTPHCPHLSPRRQLPTHLGFLLPDECQRIRGREGPASSAFPSILSQGEPPSVGFLGVERVLIINHFTRVVKTASLVVQMVKNLPAMQEIQVWPLGQEDALGQGMATHSSILAWRIPQAEESDRLPSIRSQRVRYDWLTHLVRQTFEDCPFAIGRQDTEELAWRMASDGQMLY